MRFGLIQITLGITLLFASEVVGPTLSSTVLLALPGASVLLVGIAYVKRSPGVFGKRADGHLSPWHKIIHWPYLLVAWGLWQLKSRLQGERPYDEVAPGIFVGRRPRGPDDVPPDVETVVDLTSEFSRADALRDVPRYLCLPTLDTAAPDAAQLKRLIDELLDPRVPLFIHCAMGHGRSATVAGALMLRRGITKDVDSTVAAMQAQRPRVHLHREQREALLPYCADPS